MTLDFLGCTEVIMKNHPEFIFNLIKEGFSFLRYALGALARCQFLQ